MLKHAAAALAVFAGLAAPAWADSETSDWALTTFTLDNGMDVVVLPDTRAPVVTHMVWYKVGAAHEAPGKSGIAHLFEHVMFQETDDLAPGGVRPRSSSAMAASSTPSPAGTTPPITNAWPSSISAR